MRVALARELSLLKCASMEYVLAAMDPNSRKKLYSYDELQLTMKEMLESSLKTIPIFNGGWGRLIEKVENIEEQITATNKKFDKIYDPDEGLFARFSKIESDNERTVDEMEKNISEVRDLEEKLDTSIKHVENVQAELRSSLEHLKKSVDTFETWRTNIVKTAKSIAKLVGAVLVGVGTKILIDLIVKS